MQLLTVIEVDGVCVGVCVCGEGGGRGCVCVEGLERFYNV